MGTNQFIRTKKGTKLPLLNLKGKLYLQPAYRVVWMREDQPAWTIDSSDIRTLEKGYLVLAKILNEEGRLISTGFGFCGFAEFQDPIEKAETSAIGRALKHAGFGTEQEGEAEDEIKLCDAPVDKDATSIIDDIEDFNKRNPKGRNGSGTHKDHADSLTEPKEPTEITDPRKDPNTKQKRDAIPNRAPTKKELEIKEALKQANWTGKQFGELIKKSLKKERVSQLTEAELKFALQTIKNRTAKDLLTDGQAT